MRCVAMPCCLAIWFCSSIWCIAQDKYISSNNAPIVRTSLRNTVQEVSMFSARVVALEKVLSKSITEPHIRINEALKSFPPEVP